MPHEIYHTIESRFYEAIYAIRRIGGAIAAGYKEPVSADGREWLFEYVDVLVGWMLPGPDCQSHLTDLQNIIALLHRRDAVAA